MYIQRPGRKLKHIDIERIDSRFAIKFPDSYKEFLLLNNGGVAFLSEDDPSYAAVFFEILELEMNVGENEKSGFIPIGRDPREHTIYIKIDTGEVVLDDKIIARDILDYCHRFTKSFESVLQRQL